MSDSYEIPTLASALLTVERVNERMLDVKISHLEFL